MRLGTSMSSAVATDKRRITRAAPGPAVGNIENSRCIAEDYRRLADRASRVVGSRTYPFRGICVAVGIAEHHSDDLLTDREIDVLQLVAMGKANKTVADELSISDETVKSHMKSIMAKLSANDRTHAVTIAMKRGILSQ